MGLRLSDFLKKSRIPESNFLTYDFLTYVQGVNVLLYVMEKKKGVVIGLYWVVRRAYTVASFAALS